MLLQSKSNLYTVIMFYVRKIFIANFFTKFWFQSKKIIEKQESVMAQIKEATVKIPKAPEKKVKQ